MRGLSNNILGKISIFFSKTVPMDIASVSVQGIPNVTSEIWTSLDTFMSSYRFPSKPE